MTLFIPKTRESQGGLSSSPVFFGEIDGEFMDYFTGVACESAEETAVSVHDDEAEAGVVFEEFGEVFCVEFVVAEVEGCVYWFEGFKVDVEFALFSFVCDHVTKQELEDGHKRCFGWCG